MMILWRYFPVVYTLPFLFATTQFSSVAALSELARWVVLFVALLFAGKFGFRRMGRRRGMLTGVDLILIAFLMFCMLSSIWSINSSYSVQRAVSMMLLLSATFWTLWHYADRYSEQKLIDGLLFPIVLVLSANLTLGWLAPRPIIAGRFNGFFENPNNIGIIAALAGSLALLRWFERKRWTDFLAVSVIMANLILAGTRTALLAVSVVILLHISRSLISKPLKAILVLIILAVGLGYITQTTFFAERILRIDTLSDASNRQYFWELAKSYITNHPMLGHGFGSDIIIHDYYGTYLEDLGLRGAGVMSSYYGAAVQVGIPLAVSIFALLWGFLFYVLTVKSSDFRAYYFASVIVGGLVVSIFEPVLFSAGNAFSFLFYTVFMLLLRRLTYMKKALIGSKSDFILAQCEPKRWEI